MLLLSVPPPFAAESENRGGALAQICFCRVYSQNILSFIKFCALSVAQCIVEAFLSVVSYYEAQAGLERYNLISPAHLRIQGRVSSAGLNSMQLKRELEGSQLNGVPRAQG